MSALARFTSFDARSGPSRLGATGGTTQADGSSVGIGRRGFTEAMHRVAPNGGCISFLVRCTGTDVLRRRARGRGLRLMLRTGVMALAAAALAAGGLEAATGLVGSRPAAADALGNAATGPRWTEIRRPLALYDLAGTDFSKLPGAYRARRREPDGAREDIMTFGGRPGDARAYLQVSLLRAGAEEPHGAGQTPDGLADGLARLAGARGLTATRVRPAAAMETRLGRFEAADLLLWDAGTSTPCLGFRGGGAALGIAGFACGAPGRPMGRAALACAIDRIDLVSAGDDAALRAVFVAAERRGGATCLGGPSLAAVAPPGHALGWLDPDGDLPPLRGLFAATNRQR